MIWVYIKKVTVKILYYLDKMNNDTEFKKIYPDITAQEYLCAKVHNDISPKRLINILSGKAKRITLSELVSISRALQIDINELFKD